MSFENSQGQARDVTTERLVAFALLWALVVTVIRGFQWPNDWAEAQWLVTYDLGFIKRGLPGTLLGLLYSDHSLASSIELLIKVTSTVILMSFFVMLYWAALRVVRRSGMGMDPFLVAMAFLASPYVVMSANLNGYYDSLFGILIGVAVALAAGRRVWTAAIVLSVGMFVHESVILLGVPVVVLAAFLAQTRGIPLGSPGMVWFRVSFRALVPFVLPLLALAAYMLYEISPLAGNSEQRRLALEAHFAGFEFVRENAGENLAKNYARSVVTFFRRESPFFVGRITDYRDIVLIVPTLILLLCLVGRSLRSVRCPNLHLTYVVAICLLPLSLHLVAFDSFRIWTYPLFVAAVATFVVCNRLPRLEAAQFPISWLGICATMVLGLNVVLVSPIFNKSDTFEVDQLRVLAFLPALLILPWAYSRAAARRGAMNQAGGRSESC